MPVVGSTDELLFQLVKRTSVIAGARFKKRTIAAHLVSEQVELLLVLAKGFLREISKDEALERATLLLRKITTRMEPAHVSQFKLHVEAVHALLSNELVATMTEDFETAVSAMTLMSVEETARDVMVDDGELRDPYESLLAVASLFLGHLSVLQLPERMGVVDFMDSWSAVIHEISNDVLSAADFLTMIHDNKSLAGLSSRDTEYNFLQLVADPKDAVASELLRIASGTQVLDILTALLSGAPHGLFSPNVFRGTVVACLMTLLSTTDAELNEFQWSMVDKMVHTVRLITGATTPTVEMDPESALSKLLFRVLRVPVSIYVTTSRFYVISWKKWRLLGPKRLQNKKKYKKNQYLTLVETMSGFIHDPSTVAADIFAPEVLVDSEELPLTPAHAVHVVMKRAFCTNFERVASNVLRAVFQDDHGPSQTDVWPTYPHTLPKLLLLQKRTERYTLQKSDGGQTTWVRNNTVLKTPVEDTFFGVRAMTLVRQKYDAFLRERRKLRQDHVAQAQ